MTFEPGDYYVGDPGFVLPNDDLRMLFSHAVQNGLTTGDRELVVSRRWENNKWVADRYWYVATPHKQGTIYDQYGNGWGFDWGCFGVVPWKWIDRQESYQSNKVKFTKSFECLFTKDAITIGHLHFTFNPK